MSSLLTLEDGTGVAAANSYVDADAARVYATAHGVTLPAVPGSGPDQVEIWLILAAQYLDSLSFIGALAQVNEASTQGLAWPRVLTFPYLGYPYYPYPVGEWSYPIDASYYVLPNKIKNAQCQLCIEQMNGITLQPSTPGGTQFITREKVDVIETNYSEKLGTLSTPTMPIVDSLLRGLTIAGGGSIRAVRA